jgi:hypothetical protein
VWNGNKLTFNIFATAFRIVEIVDVPMYIVIHAVAETEMRGILDERHPARRQSSQSLAWRDAKLYPTRAQTAVYCSISTK